MSKVAKAFIGLGANLGDARGTLEQAVAQLNVLPKTTVRAVSSFYRTAPVDAQGPDFINAVACCLTELSAVDLLQNMQAIESQFGRERPYHHAPRTLDLDLLLYDGLVMQTPFLTLPHPAMHLRRFVLEPLLELNHSLAVPGCGNVVDLLKALPEQRIERL